MDTRSIGKNIADGIYNGPYRKLLVNPIAVSALLTAAIMLILVFVCNNGSLAQTSFYIMCMTTLVIFTHNNLILREHRQRLCSKDEQDICDAIDTPNIGGGSDVVLDYLNTI